MITFSNTNHENFTSRACSVCTHALQLAFDSVTTRHSYKVAYHATQESLIESALWRSCHLCRLIAYHLQLHWIRNKSHTSETELPISRTQNDFASGFEFIKFCDARKMFRRNLIGLPETFNEPQRYRKLKQLRRDLRNHTVRQRSFPSGRLWLF